MDDQSDIASQHLNSKEKKRTPIQWLQRSEQGLQASGHKSGGRVNFGQTIFKKWKVDEKFIEHSIINRNAMSKSSFCRRSRAN